MAGAAGTAPAGLLQVDKMQVLIAIAKTSQRSGLGGREGLFFVASKAQVVDIRIVRGIKLFWVVSIKQPELAAAVRLMACHAVFVFQRAMPVWVVVEPGFHVLQLFAVGADHGVDVVAAQAQVKGELEQQRLHLAGVRVVAIEALGTSAQCLMRHAGAGQYFSNFLVATGTQLAGLLQQQFGVIGVVWVMAIGAVGLRRGVRVGALEHTREFFMAAQAQCRHWFDQRPGLLGVAIGMAERAVARFKRRVGCNWFACQGG